MIPSATKSRMSPEEATPEATRDLKGMLNTIFSAMSTLGLSIPIMGTFTFSFARIRIHSVFSGTN